MHDLRRAEWRTRTYSGGNGSCVEVAGNIPGIVAVRDSKDRQGPALVFTPEEWNAFLDGVRADEFDLR
jgi:Domain of unknown function (DUF397)